MSFFEPTHHGPRNWLVCLDSSIYAFYAFQFVSQNLKKQFGDHLFLLSVTEKPQKFLRTDEVYNSLIAKQEELCKKILSFYAHRASALGVTFTMLAGGSTSSLGKKICLAAKQFNIDVVVTGKQGTGPLKTGLGSASSYIVENCGTSVLVVKPPLENVISDQERLTHAIQNEKLIDIAYVYKEGHDKEAKIQYEGPVFTEFMLKDIDSVLREFKQEQEDLKKDLQKIDISTEKKRISQGESTGCRT